MAMSLFKLQFSGQSLREGSVPYFWGMLLFCFIIPLPILSFRRTRTVFGTSIASASVVLGMWLERFVIIVPTLTWQRLSVDQAFYIPTWVEWSILAGCVSLFLLLYALFTKVFPIISIWEIQEGRENAVSGASKRIRSYLPGKDLGSRVHRGQGFT